MLHDDSKDVLWLLKMVKRLSVGIDNNNNELLSALMSLERLPKMCQRPLETNDAYLERFKEYWATGETAAGEVCLVPSFVRYSDKYKNMNNDQWKEAVKVLTFFLHSDRIRFGSKVREISEQVVLGNDKFPTTIEQTYRILTDTQQRLNADRVRRNTSTFDWRSSGHSNYQGGSNGRTRDNLPTIPEGANIVIGTDRGVHTIQCRNCNEWGHYANCCPEASNGNNPVSIKSFIFKCSHAKCHHNYSSVLRYILDTGSTHNTVKDKNDIINLTRLSKKDILRMHSSTGDTMDYSSKGWHKNFNVEMFYNKNTAANILAFHTLSALDEAYMVYDSRVADCFRLIYKNGKELQFQNHGDGLYTYVDPKENLLLKNPDDCSFAQYLQTVKDNENIMTKQEIERAKAGVEV